MEPEQFHSTSWLAELRGRVVPQPPGVEQGTCFPGGGRAASYLDYWVCDQKVAPLILGTGFDMEAPFGTHRVVQAELAKHPAAVKIPQARSVRDIPEKDCVEKGFSWKLAEQLARQKATSTSTESMVQEALAKHPRKGQMEILEQELQQWARAAEGWHLSRTGLEKDAWKPFHTPGPHVMALAYMRVHRNCLRPVW